MPETANAVGGEVIAVIKPPIRKPTPGRGRDERLEQARDPRLEVGRRRLLERGHHRDPLDAVPEAADDGESARHPQLARDGHAEVGAPIAKLEGG